jgi:hypothetical protein
MRSYSAAVLVALLAPMALCAGVVLQGHRLIQFESAAFGRPTSENTKHGSPRAAVRGVAVTDAAATLAANTPLVVEASDLPDDVAELLARAAGGLIVLGDADLSAEAAQRLARLEAEGVKQQAAGPVFYVSPSANVTAFRQLLATSANVHLHTAATPAEPRTAEKSSKVIVLTAEAVEPAPKGQSIVVAAGFDTLGAFPSAPQRGASSADAALLLELAFMFGGRKAAADAKGTTGLSFLLASGARHSYLGLKNWAAAGENLATLDKVSAFLCLESAVGTPASKWALHSVTDAAKDATLDAVAKALKATTAAKRIDPSSNELRWPHEVFAHKGVMAATLTTQSGAPKRQVNRDSIVGAAAEADDVVRAAEQLAPIIAQLTGVTPAGAPQRARVARHLALLEAEPRPSYGMPARTVTELQKRLQAAVAGAAEDGVAEVKTRKADDTQGKRKAKGAAVKRSEFPFAPLEAGFHGPDLVVITAYPTRSTAFELTITATIVAGAVIAAVAVLGVAGAKELLRNPLSK